MCYMQNVSSEEFETLSILVDVLKEGVSVDKVFPVLFLVVSVVKMAVGAAVELKMKERKYKYLPSI